jgi:hypothetical protein
MADISTLSQLLEASLDPRQHKEGKYTFHIPTRTAALAMWMPPELAESVIHSTSHLSKHLHVTSPKICKLDTSHRAPPSLYHILMSRD